MRAASTGGPRHDCGSFVAPPRGERSRRAITCAIPHADNAADAMRVLGSIRGVRSPRCVRERSSAHKRWPEHFVKLAHRFLESVMVWLIGSPNDRPAADPIRPQRQLATSAGAPTSGPQSTCWHKRAWSSATIRDSCTRLPRWVDRWLHCLVRPVLTTRHRCHRWQASPVSILSAVRATSGSAHWGTSSAC
jgi:hypothetical protein